jgi:hypothetical protein
MTTYIRGVIVVILLTIVVPATPSSGQSVPMPRADDSAALGATATAVLLSRQFHDSIWPGFNLDQFPFLVYVPERWALLVNAPASVNGFTEYPGQWPELFTRALFHQGRWGELVGQLVFDLSVDSCVVAAVAYDGKGERSFFEFIVHENFHQFQHARFGEIPWVREELYPIENASNTALATLEIRSLIDALRFVKQDQADSVRSAVAWFLAVRASRWLQATPNLTSYEQGQEINEGTAKYVEMKAVSLVPGLTLSQNRAGSPGTLLISTDSASMPDCLLEALGGMIQNGSVAPEHMPRKRIYPVGAAEGFLLDYLHVDWKPIAQKAGSEFTYARLLERTIEFDSSETAQLLAAAKSAYDYDSILAHSNILIAEHRAGFSRDSVAFESQPGLQVNLHLSGKNLRRSVNSTGRNWLTNEGSLMLNNRVDVYVLQSASSQELFFRLEQAPLLEQNNWETREKLVSFFCPEIASCIIDGAARLPSEKWDCSFDSLHIIGTHFELKTSRHGTIYRTDKGILLDLLP